MNNRQILDDMVKRHEKLISDSESELVQFALANDLDLSLTDAGYSNRYLVLNDGTAGDGMWEKSDTEYFGKSPGDWIYSSETY